MSKKFVSPSGEQFFYFCVFTEHHYSCDSFFATSIFSVFPLRMELNALKKFTNKVKPRGSLHEIFPEFDGLTESVMLWIAFSEIHFHSLKEFSQFLVRYV